MRFEHMRAHVKGYQVVDIGGSHYILYILLLCMIDVYMSKRVPLHHDFTAILEAYLHEL